MSDPRRHQLLAAFPASLTAVGPVQAVSKSRKQVATDALRQAVANVRHVTPPPASVTPPLHAARGVQDGPLRPSKASSEPPLTGQARVSFASRDSVMGTQALYPARQPGGLQGIRPASKPAQGSLLPSRGPAGAVGTGTSARKAPVPGRRPASKQLVGFHSPARQLTGRLFSLLEHISFKDLDFLLFLYNVSGAV